MTKLLILFDDQYPGCVTFRGGSAIEKLMAKFNKYGFVDAIKIFHSNSFSYVQIKLQFSGSLIHQLFQKEF